jgi:uncharacterized protein (DUF1778 family)
MADKPIMLSLRVSEAESQMIKEAALEAGMTVSQWIRARIVGSR